MPGGQVSKRTTLTILALCALAACETPTSSEWDASPSFARGKTSGAPTVTSTSPSSSARGVTLDVRVFGSGFDASSQAQWAIKGVPSPKVVVNSTRYVSSGEVDANITIASDADMTLYDVMVSAIGGKPGIGSEMFLVTLEEADLPSAGGTTSAAVSVNDQGVIVGMTTDRTTGRPGTEQPRYPARWDLVNGKWTLTKLASVPSLRAIAHAINASNVIVGMSNLRAMVWLPNGQTVDLGSGCATGINASNYIVGSEVTSTGYKGVVWIPTQGTWVPQYVPGALDPNTSAMYSCEFSPLRAINGAGTIAGTSGGTALKWFASGPTGPWGNPVILEPGPYGKGVNGEAWAINEAGDVAGVLNAPEGVAPHLWRADGSEIHYLDYGSGTGFGFGINDSQIPAVVAGAWDQRFPVVIFGGQPATRLSRYNGTGLYGGAWDVNNGTATQPLRIVGSVNGNAKVWTAR